MRVMIVGYGQMGHQIEQILKDRGHKISYRVDLYAEGADLKEVTAEALANTDVAIEFALPESLDKSIHLYAETKTPVVVGTTGWQDQLDSYRKIIEEKQGTFLHGTNYSIGAHIFFKLTETAAALVNKVQEYDIMVTEYHHRLKRDSPSGTALTTAEKILANHEGKKRIVSDRLDRAIMDDELHVASVRGGSIPGTHTVTMDSPADTIELTHSARNRGGFALGAVLAAEWIQDKSGWLTVEDFIKDFLG